MYNDHFSVVERLLSEDAKIHVLDRDNRSPLILAAINSSDKMLQLLLDNLEQKNLVNIPDRNGHTVLFYAIKSQRSVPLLELLLGSKLAKLEFVNKDKNTALHYSIIQKNNEAAEMLLESGAEIDAKNIDNRTALMLAALAGDEALTRVLLEYGADTDLKDKTGKTALDLCMSSQNPNCIKLLEGMGPRSSGLGRTDFTESDSFPTTKSNSNVANKNPLSKFKSEPNLNTETYESEEEDNTSQLATSPKNPSELVGLKRIVYDILGNNDKKASNKEEGSDLNSWTETTESVPVKNKVVKQDSTPKIEANKKHENGKLIGHVLLVSKIFNYLFKI